MGHSKIVTSAVGSGRFKPELSREDVYAEYACILKSKKGTQVVDYLCETLLPLLPDGSAKLPLYYTVRYGIQFMWDAEQYGLEYAAKKLAKKVVKEQVIPLITSMIWDHIEDELVENGASTALVKPAEEALNKTLVAIFEKGVEAL